MNEKRQGGQRPSSIKLDDIYFVLFRRKWMVIIPAVLGLIGAVVVYIAKPVMYQSEAQLLVKYVRESSGPSIGSSDSHVMPVDQSGEGIINTEVAILGSFDVAMHVVTNTGNLGAEKILAKAGGGNDPIRAADFIRDNLTIDRVPRSPVLRVMFSHPDRELVKPLLTEIIDAYQSQHTAIHGYVGKNLDSYVEETQTLKNELEQTQEALRKKKQEVNIIDLDSSLKAYNAQITQYTGQISTLEDDLALHQGILNGLKSHDSITTTNLAATNQTAEVATNKTPPIPQETLDDYNQTVGYIDAWKKQVTDMREEGMSVHSKLVVEKQEQIADAEKHRKDLEKDEPRLAKLKKNAAIAGADSSSAGMTSSASVDPASGEQAQVDLDQLRLGILQKRLGDLQTTVSNLSSSEGAIRELERNQNLQEAEYNKFLTDLKTTRIDIDIGGLKDANIVPTEDPMPPSLAFNKTPKAMIVLAVGGIGFGVLLAFLTEYYFDHTVKRSKQVEDDLGMRLFLSIPFMVGNGKGKRPQLDAPRSGNGANGDLHPVKNGANGNLEVAAWDKDHSMQHHSEALRDRLISYFEANNLNHKPKLVAVTGAGQGCGTTTIASGLAASLSQTGEGNVLLIDMNVEHGAAQQFYHGKPGRELNHALVKETRDTAMVQKGLYLVSGSKDGDQLARMLPKRFAGILPDLHASNFDYIIFDMPPIARTGVTQRLAGFMDMMLLVVEAEKSNREVVKQAGSLLKESKANVSVVLNKTRTYIPAKLHQEF